MQSGCGDLVGPASCTQTAGGDLQEQLDYKVWREAEAIPTKLPSWELRKGQLHSSGQSPVSSTARGYCALCRGRPSPVRSLYPPRAVLRNQGPRVEGGAEVAGDEEVPWVAWRLLWKDAWHGDGEH